MFGKKIYLTLIVGLGLVLGGSLTAYMIVMLMRFPMFKMYLALITGLCFLLAGSLSLYKNKQKKKKKKMVTRYFINFSRLFTINQCHILVYGAYELNEIKTFKKKLIMDLISNKKMVSTKPIL